MKIFSYNVNGLRAAMTKGFVEWLSAASPDVICLQEIKALESQIDLPALEEIGYTYHYFHSAEKKGYSGVAILSKTAPTQVEVGAGIDYMDREGRILRAELPSNSQYATPCCWLGHWHDSSTKNSCEVPCEKSGNYR